MKPEMLLWLAGRMGLWHPRIVNGEVVMAHEGPLPRGPIPFTPHTDRAQFADVLLWAAKNGYEPSLMQTISSAWSINWCSEISVEHDSTDAGIMRAAIEAVCLAGEWEEASMSKCCQISKIRNQDENDPTGHP